MDFEELTKIFTPLTLTESISLIKTDEPFVLKSRLGRNTQNMLDELVVYEVEEGSYNLAPVGFPNDPPSNVNIAYAYRAGETELSVNRLRGRGATA